MRLEDVLSEAGVTFLLGFFVSECCRCRDRACYHGLTRRELVLLLDLAEQLESHVDGGICLVSIWCSVELGCGGASNVSAEILVLKVLLQFSTQHHRVHSCRSRHTTSATRNDTCFIVFSSAAVCSVGVRHGSSCKITGKAHPAVNLEPF